jgi:succinoglycan biosynthesis transport protein ExoP
MADEPTNGSLEPVLGMLRRRTPWIVLCVLLTACAAYGFSKHQTKKYTATASLVFNNNQPSQQVAGVQVVENSTQQAQQNTNVKLVQLGDMAAKTASRLGQGLTKETVSADLSVSAEGESNIVDVSATSTSPTLAADIANTYTKLFVTVQQNSHHRYYRSALALVNKQLAALPPRQKAGTAGLALQERAQSLGLLAELQTGTVQIAQAATVPTSPSSPLVTRNTILGAILGLLLGLGVAFLLERSDRRIREPGDLEAIYRLPLLGVVPESRAIARSARRRGRARESLPHNEAEVFQMIRAHLRYTNVDRELRTLLVVSAAQGDGKTTIARHLASAAARIGSRVLLLEADLREPTLARQLNVQPGPGLWDVLMGRESLSAATQTVDLGPPPRDDSRGQIRPGEPTLDVLVAGAGLPPNPGELIESQAMAAVLEQARSTYDLVVIDTPPLATVSDAFPLLREVDGVIIVGRVGRNRRDVAQRFHETLEGTDAPLLGVIANGFKARRGSYGYGSRGGTRRQADGRVRGPDDGEGLRDHVVRDAPLAQPAAFAPEPAADVAQPAAFAPEPVADVPAISPLLESAPAAGEDLGSKRDDVVPPEEEASPPAPAPVSVYSNGSGEAESREEGVEAAPWGVGLASGPGETAVGAESPEEGVAEAPWVVGPGAGMSSADAVAHRELDATPETFAQGGAEMQSGASPSGGDGSFRGRAPEPPTRRESSVPADDYRTEHQPEEPPAEFDLSNSRSANPFQTGFDPAENGVVEPPVRRRRPSLSERLNWFLGRDD